MSMSSVKSNGYNYLNNSFTSSNNGGSSGSSVLGNLISGSLAARSNSASNNGGGVHTTATTTSPSTNLDLKQQVAETCDSFENFNLDVGTGGGTSTSGNKMSIAYINEIVESYALRFFKDCERDLYKRIGKDCGWKDLVKNINYKKLRVRHEKPVYKDTVLPGMNRKPYSLFRSTFVNDTDNEQEYQLRTERRTTAQCEIEISKGYVTEGSADFCLEIPIPGCVAEIGAGFKREYSMDNRTSKNVEEEMTWSVESAIKVPKMHKTIAELVITEDKYQGEFEIKTYFSGSISVKLFKDGTEVLAFDFNDLDELFSKDRGFMKDANGIFYVTRGQCKASFGIEQKILLKQLPLNDATTNAKK